MGGSGEVRGASLAGPGPGERHYQRLTNNNQHQFIEDLNTPEANGLANFSPHPKCGVLVFYLASPRRENTHSTHITSHLSPLTSHLTPLPLSISSSPERLAGGYCKQAGYLDILCL